MKNEISGDIINVFEKKEKNVALIHGCNCFCLMGAGLAKQIRAKYPKAYESDSFTETGDWNKLGKYSFHIHNIPNRKYVINLYTQFKPGRNFEYFALINGLKRLKKAFPNKDIEFLLPLIGCGIGGGDWEYVELIIDEQLKEYNYTIVHYEAPVKLSHTSKI